MTESENTCIQCGAPSDWTNICKDCQDSEPDFSEAHYQDWDAAWIDDFTPRW